MTGATKQPCFPAPNNSQTCQIHIALFMAISMLAVRLKVKVAVVIKKEKKCNNRSAESRPPAFCTENHLFIRCSQGRTHACDPITFSS